MRILFWMFSGFDRHTTSEHLLSAVIEQICQNGNTVHIIQKNTGGDLPHVPQELLNYPVTTDVVFFKTPKKDNFIARYCSDLIYIHSCKKNIVSGYDAVFIQSNNVAGFALKVVKEKLPDAVVTLNVQDIFPYNAVFCKKIKKESIVFKFLSFVQRYGYNKSDHIITISDDMKDLLIKDGVSDDKISVIYNWSYQDEAYGSRDLSPRACMFNKDYFNVVYAGNIGVMQNVDILVKAANEMKSETGIWFHIIGDGIYKEELIIHAQAYGIKNISFWPMQAPESAPVIYSTADINIIPLVKDIYRTALPSKTAVCLSCGKPIIFAIGRDSKFGKKAALETNCPLVDSDDLEAICRYINDFYCNMITVNTKPFYNRMFLKSVNSYKYSCIITSEE